MQQAATLLRRGSTHQKYPCGHSTLTTAVPALGHAYPAVQGRQLALLEPPIIELYVPALHGTGSGTPVPAQYAPVVQL